MQQESLKEKTVKGTIWSFANAIGGQGVTFIVGLVLARLLSPEEYGLIGIITIFISVFNCLIDSGISNALIRKNDANEEDYNTAFFANLAFSIFFFVVMYAIAPLIASFFNRPILSSLTRVMSIVVVINAVRLVHSALLIKNVDFKTNTYCSLTSGISSGVIGIGMALQNYGIWSLVGQQISRQLINTCCLWYFARWKPKIQFSYSRFIDLWSFGWKLMVSSLLNTCWNQIYQVVIGKCYTPATLGLYTRALQFVSICSDNLNQVLQSVSYPVLCKLQDNKDSLRQGYRRFIKMSMAITFPLMLGLASCGKSLILITIGPKWLVCVPFLQVLCLLYLLYPLHSINLNMLQVLGRSDLFLKLEVIKKCVAVIPILIGVFYDIMPMLYSSIVASVISLFINTYYSKLLLNYGVKEQIVDIYPSLVIAIVMAVVIFPIQYLPINNIIILCVQILFGGFCYFLLSRFFNKEQYDEVKNIYLILYSKIK